MIYKPVSSKGYIYLKNNFEQIDINISSDGLLKESEKQEFFKFLSKYNGIEEEDTFKKECCINFFYQNQFKGTKHEIDCKLGNVATSEDLKITRRKMNFPLRSSKILSREKSYDDFVELISGVLNINDMKQKFGESFRQYTIWLFEDPDGTPFKSNKYLNKELRDLLGLGHILKDIELFGLVIKVSKTLEIFKPTAFDAEFNIYWRPGGSTLVLNDIYNFKKYSQGLLEFIAQGKAIKWDLFDNEIIRLN